MKILWMFWWIANIFWMTIFAAGAAFIWLREVDGAGAVQTPELRLVAFLVLIIAFIIPVAIQAVWLIINLKIKSNRETKIQHV